MSSINVQTPEGLRAVRSALSEEIKNKIAELDGLESRILQMRAGLEEYGLAKITESCSVTEYMGLVLGAGEKNAANPRSIMHEVSGIGDRLDMTDSVPHIPLGERSVEQAVMDLLTDENFKTAKTRSFMLYNPDRKIWAFVHAERWDVNFSGYCATLSQGGRFFIFQRNIQAEEGMGWLQKFEVEGTFEQISP